MSENKALVQVENSIDKIMGKGATRQISMALSNTIGPEAFLRAALTAINKQPKLRDCTQTSLAMALMDCAQTGLLADGRHAHLIPYGKEAKLIIDWKGYVSLGLDSGIKKWRAEIVRENDVFKYDAKTGIVKVHDYEPFNDRGEPIGAYSYVVLPSGEEDYELMSKAEIMAIKERSKAKDSGPWKTDEMEMWKKCPIRRHSKRLPLGERGQKAIESDFDMAFDINSEVEVSERTRPQRKSEAQQEQEQPKDEAQVAQEPETTDKDAVKESLIAEIHKLEELLSIKQAEKIYDAAGVDPSEMLEVLDIPKLKELKQLLAV